jgi:hypothetical protein
VKLRIIVLMLCGVAGAGASFAFAGSSSHKDGPCQHAAVVGTVSAPQTFTVTVAKSWGRSNLTAGQTVNVAVGSSGQTVRFMGEGCVGTDGTLTVRGADLHVVWRHWGRGDGDKPPTTTNSNTPPATTTTKGDGDHPPTTTNTNPPPPTTTTKGDGDHPPTTTNSNTPPPTTTSTTPGD